MVNATRIQLREKNISFQGKSLQITQKKDCLLPTPFSWLTIRITIVAFSWIFIFFLLKTFHTDRIETVFVSFVLRFVCYTNCVGKRKAQPSTDNAKTKGKKRTLNGKD